MNETTNYGLKKPEQDDFYDIDDMNHNADTLDTELQKNAQATATAQTTADQALGAVGSINASTPEQVAAVGAKVDAVSSKVTAVDGKVVAVDGKVTTVGTKVDTANTGITGIKSDIANLDGDVAAIGTKVGAVDSKVVAVDGKVTTVGTKVDTANTAITGVSGKIGASTDGETAATLFGRMLGMRNVVDWVKNTWTAAKATLLDVAVSTRAPASTALSTATWTSTRAGKLDNLDGKISEVGKSLSKKLMPSDNVKYEVNNLSCTLPVKPTGQQTCVVILNQIMPYSGIVKVKIATTLRPEDSYLRCFNPYLTYNYEGYGNITNNDLLSVLLLAIVGSSVSGTSAGHTRGITLGKIHPVKSEYRMQAVKECPVLLFLDSTAGGPVSISSVQICYDEVTT